MLVDRDIDVYTMDALVKGVSIGGSAHVTADDLEDEERVRAEDKDEGKSNSDGTHEGDGSSDCANI